MKEHPIGNLMETTMEKIRNMIDVNTIIGTPVKTDDGTTVIPISTVSYGFAAGGSDIPSKQTTDTKSFFGGGSGAGVSIKPVAFLCISKDGDIKLINMETGNSPIEKIAEAVPTVIDKISATVNKNKKDKKKDEKTANVKLDDPEL